MTAAKTTPKKEIKTLQAKIAELEAELTDLQLLFETTMEHGTSLENELVSQNDRMEILQSKMRKYLSPQLFQALVGGTTDANTKSHKRVKLTVYFSDIVGFTDLTDTTEPEILSSVLNSYLTRMSEIALKYGGTIDKFVGDAVMVFFGAPEFEDDVSHAKRCAQMALEMREALFQLRPQWKLKGIARELHVRAGINTGFCTVGNFGSEHRMDYTIIGGQVNLAARLQSAAPADGIYISKATYSLIEEFVTTKHVGHQQVKGIYEPVEIWELTGLAEGEETPSPYLQIGDNHLKLEQLDIDLDTLSEEDRMAIQKALSRVMLQLSTKRQ
ncbi:MAG: adenylate/guanylate cyclase domain-containing protein [Chloroflexi bacterium]|nr:MAG: adenylate/guanylate cyclase domain-containing protein [Chloroflexota bacterium]